MVTTSRHLEAPRRLRAFVRAHETSLVVLGGAGRRHRRPGGDLASERRGQRASRAAVQHRHSANVFPASTASTRCAPCWFPAFGGLLLGLAFLLLLRWRPAREIDPIEANALHGGRMSFRGSIIVALQTVWSSGVGASVGLEAGYTQLVSGVAASIGRAFHLRRADQRIMVGCGAAAAIAGAFGAPLAGAFYAFELIIGGYTPASLTPIGVSAVAGFFVAHGILRRCRSASSSTRSARCAATILRLPTLLGVLAALFGIVIMRGVALCEALLAKSRLWPPLRPALGGLVVGAWRW